MTCTLLMPRRDQFHLVSNVVERIEESDIAVTTDPEHERHFLLHQELRDEIPALHCRHRFDSRGYGPKPENVTILSSLISRIEYSGPSRPKPLSFEPP